MADVIYICAAGHSGSTLLDLLIGAHERVASLGETTHLTKNIALNTVCTCGSPVRSCEVWRNILEQVNQNLNIDVFQDPYSLHLGYVKSKEIVDRKRETKAYYLGRGIVHGLQYLKYRYSLGFLDLFLQREAVALKSNFVLYDAVKKVLGVDYVVDSSKSYLKAAGLYNKHPSRVRIILLTRDGRGVFYSGIKRGYGRSYSLNSWANVYKRALPIFSKVVSEKHILNVKYEDLVENPIQQIGRIYDFVGLDYKDKEIDLSSSKSHITSGNNMRFEELNVKPDYSWRQDMAEEDRLYFEKNAGNLNRLLGYD